MGEGTAVAMAVSHDSPLTVNRRYCRRRGFNDGDAVMGGRSRPDRDRHRPGGAIYDIRDILTTES